MKAIYFLGALLISAACPAQEMKAPLISVDGYTIPASEISVVGDHKLELKFHLGALSAAGLHASLFQISGELAAPLASGLSMSESGVVAVPLPEVSRITQTLLVLSDPARAGAGKIGETRITLFPKATADEAANLLLRLAKEPGGELEIFGRAESLRNYLRAHEVPFRDLGKTPPESLGESALVIGEIAASSKDEFIDRLPSGVAALLFVDDPTLLPGVYAQKRVFTVTLPILPGLEVNPRAQHTFFTLLQELYQTR